MNKTNIILSTACAFVVINNSFGMLTKASSIKQIKKIRSASYAATTPNHELLHKIIQQNEQNNNLLKENNELLRITLQHNYLLSRSKYNGYCEKELKQLDSLHDFLKQTYNINPKE
jgi:hypothetical protein